MASKPKAVVTYGIAIDLVIIATGAALLLPSDPIILLTLFLAAVAGGAWFGDARGGATASAFSLIALAMMFDQELRWPHFAVFAVAASLTIAIVPAIRSRFPAGALAGAPAETPAADEREQIRRRLEERLAAERSRLERERRDSDAARQLLLERESEERRHLAEAQAEAELAELEAPRRPRMPRAVDFVLPFVVVFIYTNASDLLMRGLHIPSLLQPMIVIVAAIVWKERQLFRPSRIAMQPLTLLLGAYCFVVLASSIWAYDVHAADERLSDVMKNFLIYLVVATLAINWSSLRRALSALTLAAAAFGAVAIAQIASGREFGELFGFARVKEGEIFAHASDIRAAGPVGDPNFFGQILVFVIPLAVFLAFMEKRRPRRLVWLAVAATVCGGVLVTYSRGAMLAMAVMTTVLLFTLRLRMTRLAVAAGAVVGILLLLPGNVTSRFMTLVPSRDAGSPDGSIEKRKLLVGSALQMFLDHPLAGVGAGNFNANYPEYSKIVGSSAGFEDTPGQEEHAHSLYVEIGAENGLLGLTCFGGAMLAALITLWRSSRLLAYLGDDLHRALAVGLALALGGYLITSLFLHGGFQRYLWLLLALIAATRRATDDHLQLRLQEAAE